MMEDGKWKIIIIIILSIVIINIIVINYYCFWTRKYLSEVDYREGPGKIIIKMV